MNFRVYKNLFKARKELSPTREYKKALWSELEKRWDVKHLPEFRWYETAWFRLSGGVMAGVVGFASVGTVAYAYTSPEVTQGTTLYPVKQAIEQIEETIKITPESKAKFLLKKIERRQAEKDVLKKQVEDDGVPTSTVDEIEREDVNTSTIDGVNIFEDDHRDLTTSSVSREDEDRSFASSTVTSTRRDREDRGKTREFKKKKHEDRKPQSVLNLEKTDFSINNTEQQLDEVKNKIHDEDLKSAIEKQLEEIKKRNEERKERKFENGNRSGDQFIEKRDRENIRQERDRQDNEQNRDIQDPSQEQHN